MGVTAYDIINIYRGWLGTSSHRSIVDIYNAHKPLAVGYKVSYSDAWCDTCLSAAFIKADAVELIGGTECGVERHIKLFQAAGIWEEDGTVRPEPGWVITFNWDESRQPNNGWADHIGIVESVTGDTVNTIEGNCNNAVARRSYKIGDGNIRGYAKPKYETAVEPKTHTLVADVSEHQGAIDWDKFRKEIDAVIIRAYNGSREDYQWKRNVSMAEKYGIPYGVYMYSKATTAAGVANEDKALIALLQGHKPQYPVYLDRETAGTTARIAAEQFYKDISAAGFTPGLYTGWYFYMQYLDGVKTESLWLAAYGHNSGAAEEGYKPTVALDGWQFTSMARLDGIPSNSVDLSYFYTEYNGPAKVGLAYRTHCQTYGWMPAVKDGEIAGTTGQAKRIEAIKITPPEGVELEVDVHIQKKGWITYKGIKKGVCSGTGSSANDPIMGSVGEGLRLEALRIRCVKNEIGKNLKYQAHVQGAGWQIPASEGEIAGTVGYSKRLEALKIWFE